MNIDEYKPGDTRWVTIGQIFFGTIATLALVLLYVGFKYLEG